MSAELKVSRKDLINKLSGITDDNVSIGNVAINKRKLLAILKLQTGNGDDNLIIAHSRMSWCFKYKTQSHWGGNALLESKVRNEPCVKISCNHTVMRFLNRPTAKNGTEPKIAPLNLNGNGAKHKLSGIPLNSQELISALNFVTPCIATETNRPVLNCVLFDSGKGAIRLVTADGFRLASARITARGIPKGKTLIHSTDIAKLMAFLKAIKPTGKGRGRAYPEIYIKYSHKYVTFSTSDSSIKFEKQAWNFPDYKRLIPKDGAKIKFVSNEVLKATKTLSHIAKDGSGIIRLQFLRRKPHGKILLSASGNDYDGEHKSMAECVAIVPASRKVALNARYLTDLLRLCPNMAVTVRVKHPANPVVFDIDPNRQTVIMPMFVQW